jgi:hypothetical protein
MAVTRTFGAVVLVLCTAAGVSAQTVTGEVALTGGVSSDRVAAGAGQARLFGELPWFRFFAEGAWTAATEREDGRHSEAFSTAYPYEGPPRPMDVYAERLFEGRRFVGSLRAGRFRTPFGIHGASDHAYTGFLRAPLVRYEGYWSVTNMLFEHGVNVMAGMPFLQAELTVGRPGDASDDFARRPGTDVIVRAQGYHGPLVVGVSHVRSNAYDLAFATGRMIFTGVDARWMSHGVQLRGEWLTGQPWDGTHTHGGYVDAIVHRPFMGPVTLVGRMELLVYEASNPLYSSTARGGAVGARVKVLEGLYGQVNVTHRPDEPYGANVTATDVAFTYTVRYPK